MLPYLDEVILLLQVCVKGFHSGVPLNEVNEHFQKISGYNIPYMTLGHPTLKAFFATLPNFYLIEENGIECVIYHGSEVETKNDVQIEERVENEEEIERALETERTVRKSHILYRKLELMFPLFFDYQALGDDFFIDLAETQFQYFIPSVNGRASCGLCSTGQTIGGLIARIKASPHLAPKVVVMTGMNDILDGRRIESITTEYQRMIALLKSKCSFIYLITVVKPFNVHYSKSLKEKIHFLNNTINYFKDDYDVGVIDMYSAFRYNRLSRQSSCNLVRNERSSIFSKTGKKLFMRVLKQVLTGQCHPEDARKLCADECACVCTES